MSMDYYSMNNMPLGDDDDDFDDDFDDSDDMSETEVEEEGALGQLGSSVKGMLVGFVCFAVAWPVLYCGAMRTEWAKEFKNAVPVEKAEADEPAYLTGIPAADEIGDTYLTSGKYLRISKTPEVYAYVEHSKSKTKTKRKGVTRKKVKKTTTTYSYTLEWTTDPKPMSEFNQKYWNKFVRNNRVSRYAKNPEKPEKSETINSPKCTVKDYTIDVDTVSFYGGSETLDPAYIKGTKGSPRLGDKRINFTVYPSDIEYTFAGSVSGKKLVQYDANDEDSNLAAAPGNFKALIKALKSSDKLAGMMYFFGGFILMALGLVLLAGPVTTLLEFIPFMGELGSGLIKVVLVIIALILSTIFFWLIKLWWLWLIIIVAITAFIIYKRKTAQPQAA